MSVINQMLQDLENRRSQVSSSNNLSYDELSFIPTLSRTVKLETIIYVVLFAVSIASGIFAYVKINNNDGISIQTGESEPTLNTQDINFTLSTNDITTEHNKTIEAQANTIKVKSPVAIVSKPVETERDGIVHKKRRELPLEQQAENKYQSGFEYLVNKNYVKAQEELRNALMIMPRHNRSRELLAGIYIKSGRIVEARTLLQYGLRLSPAHSIFAKLYARILMEQNANVTAISVLLRNPPKQTADMDYYALLAALYQKTKQHHKAATLYRKLLKLRTKHGVWWLGMAISLEALGKDRQAKAAYEKAKNSGNLTKGLYRYTDQRVIALEEIAYP